MSTLSSSPATHDAPLSGRGRPLAAATECRLVELRNEGLSYALIATRLEEEKYATAHGGAWHSSTVFQALERLGVEQPELNIPEDVARRLLELQGDGHTYAEIRDELNEKGIRSPGGKRWHVTSVMIALRRAKRAAPATA